MNKSVKKIGKLQISLPSDREITMTRVFDAPRKLVWDALTKPELVKRWLGVQNGWTLAVCEIDLKIGGSYRYVWHGPNRAEMGMGGVYREIARPERLVATEKFDQSWYAGEAIDTSVLTEKARKTTLTLTVAYQSKEVRDGVINSPMAEGIDRSYDKLEELLASALSQETK
jgi:uncharacterized protein YndB with AHSA1/START domain